MEISAKLRYARITPQKLQLLANLCRGMDVEQAQAQLALSQKRGGKVVGKLLNSAIANAREKGGVDVDNLYIKRIEVNRGPMMKRFMPRAQGRATQILKKLSHLTIILDEKR